MRLPWSRMPIIGCMAIALSMVLWLATAHAAPALPIGGYTTYLPLAQTGAPTLPAPDLSAYQLVTIEDCRPFGCSIPARLYRMEANGEHHTTTGNMGASTLLVAPDLSYLFSCATFTAQEGCIWTVYNAPACWGPMSFSIAADWLRNGEETGSVVDGTLYRRAIDDAEITAQVSVGSIGAIQSVSFSPDGEQAVLTALPAGQTEPALFLVTMEGDSTSLGAGRGAVWLPVADEIAFTLGGNVMLMNPDGSGRRVLHSGDATAQPHLHVAPDGAWLAADYPATAEQAGQTVMLRPDGSSAVPLIGDLPRWVPGLRYLYTHDSSAYGDALLRVYDTNTWQEVDRVRFAAVGRVLDMAILPKR